MKRLEYSKDIFKDYLKYDETSKSCLRWISSNKTAGSAGSSGYTVQFKSVSYAVHRVIYCLFFDKTPEEFVIDHIDGNFYNNKISNIRLVTIRENSFNRKMSSRNTSGVTGVRFDEKENRFTATWVDVACLERTKSFNLNKYESKEKAFQAAIDFRNFMIKCLVEQNLCYTDRHGK